MIFPNNLSIIHWPNPILLRSAPLFVDFQTPELDIFINNMFQVMKQSSGIGLAANQVATLARILVIHIPYKTGDLKSWHDKDYVLINPEIMTEEGTFNFREGCLSFPKQYENLDRAQKIRVRAQDQGGNYFEIEAEDLFATCLQHEIDHLNGIVFVDRLSNLKAEIIKKKMLKRKY